MTVDQTERQAPLISAGLLESGLFRHGMGYFKRRLDARSQALFEPGEQIVLAFDGVTRLPGWRLAGAAIVGNGLSFCLGGAIGLSLAAGKVETSKADLIIGLSELAAGLAVVLVCRLLGAVGVMVAMTTLGVVECRKDWLGRPREILRRGPAVQPGFLGGGQKFRRVAIGDVAVYTSRATETMLGRAARPARVRATTPFVWTPRPRLPAIEDRT